MREMKKGCSDEARGVEEKKGNKLKKNKRMKWRRKGARKKRRTWRSGT
jgi:hypothetical protein